LDPPQAETMPLWPMTVYFLLVFIVVTGMEALSYILGQRHRQRATGEPYESGIVPTGAARLRLSVRFYLVAVFFVIFDVEAVFVIAWAVILREAGWPGYVEILVFIGVLLGALVYLWREGALDWNRDPAARTNRSESHPP
jgi:NADH-quinone oxidoreductase subunit A